MHSIQPKIILVFNSFVSQVIRKHTAMLQATLTEIVLLPMNVKTTASIPLNANDPQNT